MAGLQYNFFPTDLLYPRQQPVALDTTRKVVLPLQKKDLSKEAVITDELAGPKTLVYNNLVEVQPLVLKKKPVPVWLKEHDQA
ncbi:hypothetical protein CJ030_MR7G025990 [Morella rubra]|uniref:Uncharacterized protein n=1 Tax=Morella rubra TaxID=262757 RepID=A0A6A1V0S9_9ROSI|nr:hypothetical protein CJ030_MR7G025990 [Morella rubra]